MSTVKMPTLVPEGICLPPDWDEDEKGNTWLFRDDAQVLWIELAGGRWLEIATSPGSSPYWRVAIIPSSPERLWAHIHAKLGGWQVGRWNLEKAARTRPSYFQGGVAVILDDAEVADEAAVEDEDRLRRLEAEDDTEEA